MKKTMCTIEAKPCGASFYSVNVEEDLTPETCLKQLSCISVTEIKYIAGEKMVWIKGKS